MKKIISIIMIVAMIASIAAVNTSAAGQVYMQDTFDGTELSSVNWVTSENANAFYVEEGWCKGDSRAVVLQSHYSDGEDDPEGGKMHWTSCAASVDIGFFDYDKSDANFVFSGSLWWRDYQRMVGEEEFAPEDISTGPIYELTLDITNRQLYLRRNAGSMVASEDTTDMDEEARNEYNEQLQAQRDEQNVIVRTYDLPEDYEITIDPFTPSTHNIGWRITTNQIKCYLDGQYIFEYTSPTPMGKVKPSPMLFINNGMMVGLDNFMVTSTDYELFEADKTPDIQPLVTTAPVGGGEQNNQGGDQSVGNNNQGGDAPKETEIKEVIVTETNEAGEVVTKIDTEIVTVAPPADTNTGGSAGGTGAQTGDMAVIVIAVMVVTLGTAIVVKRVNVK